MNLDLENPKPFWEVILEDSIGSKTTLELCQENEHFVSSISGIGELPIEIKHALVRFTDTAKERIESVSAYHGCRVFDEADYTLRGIKRLESTQLISWCKDFFGLDERIDDIVEELGPDYIGHGEGGVFCMRGIEAAIKNRSYHSDGSELVRSITSRLGIEEEKYFSAGRPCFIEVCTPIEWFRNHSRTGIDCLLSDIFVHWLWLQLDLDWPGDPRRGGIEFKTDIPAEFIRAFHYTQRTQPAAGGNG
ncbi:MAG: hypothetical protein ACSHX4_05405 [Opitutaceae bacterium]